MNSLSSSTLSSYLGSWSMDDVGLGLLASPNTKITYRPNNKGKIMNGGMSVLFFVSLLSLA